MRNGCGYSAHRCSRNTAARAHALQVVLFNAILPTFTLVYLGSRVIAARKKFGVNLPTMYTTDDKKKGARRVHAHVVPPSSHRSCCDLGPGMTCCVESDFNNYQRGHQNALETASQFLVAVSAAVVSRCVWLVCSAASLLVARCSLLLD